MNPIGKKLAVGIVVVILVLLGVIFAALQWWIPVGVCWGVPVAFFLFGLKIVHEEERMVVELFGAYYGTRIPGLRWVCPILMKVRAIVPTWEQPIQLFSENPSIDFKEGGTASLVQPTIWVRTKGASDAIDAEIEASVKKMIYEIDDWRLAVGETIETALRSCLNNLTVEEVMKAVFVKEKASWWDVVLEHFPKIPEKLEKWGLEATRLTISDFDWSQDVVEIREQVFLAERKIKISQLGVAQARFDALRSALESGGTHAEMKKLLVSEYEYTPEKAEEVSAELVKYFAGLKAGRIIDIRTDGDNGISSLIAQVVASLELVRGAVTPSKGKPPKATKKKKKSEEDDEEVDDE